MICVTTHKDGFRLAPPSGRALATNISHIIRLTCNMKKINIKIEIKKVK
jgi:hypothetical protein